MTTEAHRSRARGLSRAWRLAIVAAVIWVVGYTAVNFSIYRAALTSTRPLAPSQIFDEWYLSQTQIAEQSASAAEATCREQNKSMFDTGLDEALVKAGIATKVGMGVPEEQAKKEGEAELADKKREKQAMFDKLCARTTNFVDPSAYDQEGVRRNELIDEALRRARGNLVTTLIGLALIFMAPIALGYGRRVYSWVLAGK